MSIQIENIQPTSLDKRTMGLGSTFTLWLAANVVITTVLTGMFFAGQITLYQTLFAVVVGTLIGAIPLVLTAKMGTRTGLSTMVIARGAFGQKGAVIPALVNTFILIGWSWIQAYLAGVSLNHAVKHMTGFDNVNLFVILTEALVIFFTIKGHQQIEKMERIVAILMLLMSLVIFSVLFISYDVHAMLTMKISESPAVTTAIAFDIVIATAFSWMSSVCDYNRYCKTEKESVIGTYFGYLSATTIAMMLGFVVAAFSTLEGMEATYDPAILLSDSGFGIYGVVAALVVFFSVLSTNVMALYSATYSFLTVTQRIPYRVIVISIGVLIVIGALFKESLMANFFNFILLVSTLFIPIFAIMLADFYIVNKGHYDVDDICSNEKQRYFYQGGFNLIAMFTYLVGAGFAYYYTYINPLDTGSSIFTFLLTGIVYLGLNKAFNNRPNEALATK